MKKFKILLFALLLTNMMHSTVTITITSKSSNSRLQDSQGASINHLIGVVVVLLAAKIGYDLSWHNSYTTKTNSWHELLISTIEQNNITTIDHPKLLSLFSAVDHDQILQMHTWVSNSYNCWLKPWNWTASQKQSFEKLQIIEILTLYSDLVAKKDTIMGADLVKAFRCKYTGSSTYPLIFAYEMINNHIQFICNMHNHTLNQLLLSAIEPLKNFKILLRQENEYQEEVFTKETNESREKMIQEINKPSKHHS